MIESKNAVSCKALEMLIQEHERTGICGFHYYPEDSRYVTLLTPDDAECIVNEICVSGTSTVVRDGKGYFVEDVKVVSKDKELLAGLIQIWPMKIIQL